MHVRGQLGENQSRGRLFLGTRRLRCCQQSYQDDARPLSAAGRGDHVLLQCEACRQSGILKTIISGLPGADLQSQRLAYGKTTSS